MEKLLTEGRQPRVLSTKRLRSNTAAGITANMQQTDLRELFLWEDSQLLQTLDSLADPLQMLVLIESWLPQWVLRRTPQSLTELQQRYPGVLFDPDGMYWIDPTAKIAKGASLEGCLCLGENVRINPHSYLRGACYIAADAVVGHCSEIKSSILMPGARAAHLNYVGNSMLGERVNLGAGTTCSNLRLDGKDVTVSGPNGPIASGAPKLGAIIGAECQIGCHVVLQPGTVLGRSCQVGPTCWIRRYLPTRSRILASANEGLVAPLVPKPFPVGS